MIKMKKTYNSFFMNATNSFAMCIFHMKTMVHWALHYTNIDTSFKNLFQNSFGMSFFSLHLWIWKLKHWNIIICTQISMIQTNKCSVLSSRKVDSFCVISKKNIYENLKYRVPPCTQLCLRYNSLLKYISMSSFQHSVEVRTVHIETLLNPTKWGSWSFYICFLFVKVNRNHPII